LDNPSPSFYREYAPRPALAAFVACTWVKTIGINERSQSFSVIPDSCVDIITRDGGPPHIAGPATRPHVQPPKWGSMIVGLRFRPGAARCIFECPANELRDRDVDLVDIVGRRDGLPIEAEGVFDPTSVRRALEQWAVKRLDRNGVRDASLIRTARSMMLDPTLPLDAVTQSLGWNARRQHREFVATCGYGPKMLQRIMRAQAAIRLAQTSLASCADIALAAGYADQSHMNRDFRSIVGTSPGTYFVAGRYDANYWMREFA
jgi:AraC-like DNA-binding protein